MSIKMNHGRPVMVCGFLFCEGTVLLVQKKSPEWQCGLWNGIGGRVEDREIPIEAIVREFREEVDVDIQQWRHFATELDPRTNRYVVQFFSCSITREQRSQWRWPTRNDVGEELRWLVWDSVVGVASRRQFAVRNLAWLLPLALDDRRLLPVSVSPELDIAETIEEARA